MCIGAASRDNAVGNAGKVGMPGNMAIREVEFSCRGFKIRKIFA